MEKIVIPFLIFIIILVTTVQAAFNVTCDAGGPYAKNSIINIAGNVTNNSVGAAANVSVNITKGTSLKASDSTTSGSDGTYLFSIFQSLDFDTYSVAVNASTNGSMVECSDTVEIALGINTSCQDKRITVEGTATYSDTGAFVTKGNATLAIVEKTRTNSTIMTLSGTFSVSVSDCLIAGKRYTLSIIVDDNDGKRSQSQQYFIAP